MVIKLTKMLYTKEQIKNIEEQLYLNDEERKILDLWLYNYSIIETSIKLNISTATVNRRRKQIKNKLEMLNNVEHK